jgi:transposase
MEQEHHSRAVAGVDIGKACLDVALHGQTDTVRWPNTAQGISELITWLKAREVGRVGFEASGGYERALHMALLAAGLQAVLHQPLEIRLFARLRRQRAKNDALDARLIAMATAQVDTLKAAADPYLIELAERLTAYEQVCQQAASLKAFMEHITLPDLETDLRAQIAAMGQLKARLLAQLLRHLKARADLAARYSLLLSLPGVGPVVAASLTIRMPELGALKRGQAAALIGVAPFDHDSGKLKGTRFIAGGRTRPRRMLYLAALAAKRSSPDLKAFAQTLISRGKPAKVAIVAVMRKLIEAANLVLERGQPWLKQLAT